MSAPSRHQLWHGTNEPPSAIRELRAGPLTALLDGIDLRYMCAGDTEIVRRIYVAVRDQNWNTVPCEATNMAVDVGADSFKIGFDVHHRAGDVRFAWHGSIEGRQDGTISYRIDGRSDSEFLYNRIGLCVLHPPHHSGRQYRGHSHDGNHEGNLPTLIEPQKVLDGKRFGLFPPFVGLSIALDSGAEVRFDFEGDLFEMEDQRNWTDGSFKTYSTPLSLPLPKLAHPGQTITQSVAVSATGTRESTPGRSSLVQLSLGEPIGRRLPPIGLGAAAHAHDLTAREIRFLRILNPGHLRVDVHLQSPEAASVLERAMRDSSVLGCQLEIALFLTNESDREMAQIRSLLGETLPVARVLIFHEDEQSTSGHWVQRAKEYLGEVLQGVPFAGGTNANFADINAMRPEIELMDAVTYSLNPQVHAFDNMSLIESLQIQGATVATARSFCGDRLIFVSPISLKPRFNPNAIGPEIERSGELPSQVDPRQMSLFAAGWTLGSIKYLAESGADSLTYYETTGWQGVMETEVGSSAMPNLFASTPGMVFPLFHILADVAEVSRGNLVGCSSSDPLAVVGLAIRDDSNLRLFMSNLTAEERTVFTGLPLVNQVRARRLNEDTAQKAMFEPEVFRDATAEEVLELTEGCELTVTLAPYESFRVDAVL